MIKKCYPFIIVFMCCLGFVLDSVKGYDSEASSTALDVKENLEITSKKKYIAGDSVSFYYVCMPCIEDETKGYWWIIAYDSTGNSISASQYVYPTTPVSCTPEFAPKIEEKEIVEEDGCSAKKSNCFDKCFIDTINDLFY